ncbi:hypothetical protein F4782DRAFT_252777 [Xylaria castorea]|nr:hypothetical protein F4782DRAFT_252777 [Xylaria castorea]
MILSPVMSQPSEPPLNIHPSPLLCFPVDNWQGIGNAHERRRIQNRINQRARRSRRRREATVSMDSPSRANAVQADLSLTSRHSQITLGREINFDQIVKEINTRDPESWETHSLVRAFEALIYNNWLARAPMPALLPSLVRFNLARAIMGNAKVLGLTFDQLDDEAISYFNMEGPWPISKNLEVGTLPPKLQPTDLQRRTLHHPWLDLLPIPRMRDNLLRRGMECFDEDDLCMVMVGRGNINDAGFIVWSDPWDSYGWEVTEGFARSSWGWTIAGCWELYQSTNVWRAKRGEPPLFYPAVTSMPDNP